MEQIYQLNIPPIKELIISGFNGYNDEHLSYNYIVENSPEKILKLDWLNFLNLSWEKVIYFKKQERKGSLHSDASYSAESIPPNNNLTVWGINWVYEGVRTMQYWNWENVVIDGLTPGSINIPEHGVVTKLLPKTKPYKTYTLTEGCAYLVNATLPHLAIGNGRGTIFSLRPKNKNLEWPKVVNLFTKYIIV